MCSNILSAIDFFSFFFFFFCDEALEPFVETGGAARFMCIEANRDGISKNRGDCSDAKHTLPETLAVGMVMEALLGNITARYFMKTLINNNVNKSIINFSPLGSIIAYQCQEIVSFFFFFFFLLCCFND